MSELSPDGEPAGQPSNDGSPEILVADDMDLASPAGRRRGKAVKEWSIYLAHALSGQLTFLHVDPSLILTRTESRYRRFLDEVIRGKKPRILRTGSSEGVPARWLIADGRPPREILRISRQRPQPQLLAMGTRGRSGLKRLLFGSVAEGVLRGSHLPVMLIGPAAQDGEAPVRPDRPRILAYTDLTRASVGAEQFSVRLSQRLETDLKLLHCALEPVRRIASKVPASNEVVTELGRLVDLSVSRARTELARLERAMNDAGIRNQVFLECEDLAEEELILKHLAGIGQKHPAGTGPDRADLAILPLALVLDESGRQVVARSPVPVIAVPENYRPV